MINEADKEIQGKRRALLVVRGMAKYEKDREFSLHTWEQSTFHDEPPASSLYQPLRPSVILLFPGLQVHTILQASQE